MMPGGHLVSAVALGGTAYLVAGSTELAAGCFAGGFLIDVDHYLDYLVFEKQWRRPGPASFLRYYFKNELQRVVLPLHSLELMTLLTVMAAVWHVPLLTGYLIGAAMHLAFDIAVNGDYALRNRYLFYVFGYRAAKGFKAAELLEKVAVAPGTGSHPFREFFAWRPPVDKPRRSETVADFNSASDLDPL
jgi:hypothetical protein